MRYVIIPLFVMLYAWWTISVIRDLIDSMRVHKRLKKQPGYDGYITDYTTDSTDIWLTIHVSIVILAIFALSLLYW